jgi:ATP-dependent 26S proteasome regulatory subunit
MPCIDALLSILKIHSQGMSLDDEIDLRIIAGLAEGSSGADIKALVTEAGMYAIREERTNVYQTDFENAAAKILRKDRISEPADLVQQYI